MDFNQIETHMPNSTKELSTDDKSLNIISLETEVPEGLYLGMNDFIDNNADWDQSKLLGSAIASFLFQNGSNDRAVIEKYLNDIFNLSES